MDKRILKFFLNKNVLIDTCYGYKLKGLFKFNEFDNSYFLDLGHDIKPIQSYEIWGIKTLCM